MCSCIAIAFAAVMALTTGATITRSSDSNSDALSNFFTASAGPTTMITMTSCAKTVCVDYLACGIRYGQCYQACSGYPTPTPTTPSCPIPTPIETDTATITETAMATVYA